MNPLERASLPNHFASIESHVRVCEIFKACFTALHTKTVLTADFPYH